jgi:hypothetical protein
MAFVKTLHAIAKKFKKNSLRVEKTPHKRLLTNGDGFA